MKKLNYLIALIFTAGLLVGCEEDSTYMDAYTGPGVTYFELETSTFLVNNTNPIHKLKLVTTEAPTTDMVVDISIAETSEATAGFSLPESSIIIPAGSYSAEFLIQGVFRDASESGSDLVLEINLEQPLGSNNTHTVTIFKQCESVLDGVEFDWVTTNWFLGTTDYSALGAPDATGSDVFVSIDDVSYTFESGCFDFGYYATVWGDTSDCGQGTGLGGTIMIQDLCEKLVMSGEDQWGDSWTMYDVSTDGSSLTYTWENTYGEKGTTTMTRTDGENFPNYFSD
jgi:hypothetical protein